MASISATTRPPRPGEVDGVDYHFLAREEFARRREPGNSSNVARFTAAGDWYGTLKSEVTPSLEAGKWVVLEIDVQGTLAVLEHYPDALTIFMEPASLDELERRLRDRGTESDEALSGGWRWPAANWRPADLVPISGRERRLDRAVDAQILRYSDQQASSKWRSTRMIDELREEQIVNKVGGRFKLSTLIQKRLVALNAGSRPLVNLETNDKLRS